MSSQSSTVPGWPSPPGQEERSRWWLVMHSVPLTGGSPAHDSSTLSTVAVLISSENSMAAAGLRVPLRLPPAGLEGERGNRERRSKAWKPPSSSLPEPRWALQPLLVTYSLCSFLPAGSLARFLPAVLSPQQELQAADQRLAQQLMRLRAQLHRLKVEQACHQHKEMLDDATFGLEGCEEDSDLLCNIPPKAAFLLSMPLKHIGVTRMNINSRRFSLC
uniref:Family with sequence similarity 167 member B n=2 Tax=Anatidae TaxID=8830 RepID=A0A8B9EBU7_ANSCY